MVSYMDKTAVKSYLSYSVSKQIRHGYIKEIPDIHVHIVELYDSNCFSK